MSELETVGQRINYVRTQKRLTLESLANQAGLSKSFLWEVEKGRSGISGARLLSVADALDASVDYLLRGNRPVPGQQTGSIEVPIELSVAAEELGLTHKQTLTLMDIEQSIVARRGGGPRGRKSKDEWKTLFTAVSEFLEDER